VRTSPPTAIPTLRGGPYIFPVYGPSSFTDTFGAPRADVSWHHGADIFAPLGAPILAAAEGNVFSVGWNDLGGNRLWLQDRRGNQFYYAHLSAFSPLAANGARVRAGDVIGYVGDTGDAVGTPYHLHFEIHPVSLLGRGYDGAVNPTSYLTAWPHLQRLDASGATGGMARQAATAPAPGAFLLRVSDISRASGLEPRSFRRALADQAFAEGDGAFVRGRG
jgi:murein DD-endopeptidase MepM/ murein hydrolase activator NlpD